MTRTTAKKIAGSFLARDGITAIWELLVAAKEAYRTGNYAVAAEIMKIADATEREWFGRGQFVPHDRWRARGVSLAPLWTDRKPVPSGRLAYDLKHDLPHVLTRCQRISDDLIAFVRSRPPIEEELHEAA